MKAAGYIRVSSVSQFEGTSLDVQKTQIQAYCTLRNLELVDVYCDPAVSGGRPIEDRPEGSRLMAAVRAGEIQSIVITKLDRGFRDTRDCLATVDTLDKLGVSLHIIDLGGGSVDSQSPAGRFMLTVLAAAAEMERGQIKVRCASGRERRRAEGKTVGGLPFGYQLGADGKTLVPDLNEQRLILEVKDLKAQGLSLRAIARDLNERGIKGKRGGIWQLKQVRAILDRN